MCRPHFHAPLPWLDKPWGYQEDKPAGAPGPHPLFSFPPTPPKDATPDSVPSATDYQAAVAHAAAMSVAFMQQQQQQQPGGQDQGPGDVKPMLACAAQAAKQREGAQGGESAYGGYESGYPPYPAPPLYAPRAASPHKPRAKSRTSAGEPRRPPAPPRPAPRLLAQRTPVTQPPSHQATPPARKSIARVVVPRRHSSPRN